MTLLHPRCFPFDPLQFLAQICASRFVLFDLLAEDVLRLAEDLAVILYLVGQSIVLEFHLYIFLLYQKAHFIDFGCKGRNIGG